MHRLTKRSEYLKVARGARTPRRGFLLQSAPRDGAPPDGAPRDGAPRTDGAAAGDDAAAPARFGFTVTKKIGNAVVRNRIRRRLKEAVRLHGARSAAAGIDYVLVGRRPALDQPFADLVADVVGAIRNAGRSRPADERGRGEQKRPQHG